VFFLPGMAVFGISGVVLVVGSLVLVTLAKAPTTSEEWVELGGILTRYTLSLVGGIVAAFFIARYLPQIPYANRLLLKPPAEEEAAEARAPALAAAGALLGAIGEAATNLRPAGKARFGEDFLDVVAEGSYVNAGGRVQVIEIEGNRIVVKEV
jgi:membrane-bound ClpP family serine protease